MMTQAILSTTNMDPLKLTFDDVYCEAEVDALTQIPSDTDSCALGTMVDDGEKSKENENLNKSGDDKVNILNHPAPRNKLKRKARRQRRQTRPAPYTKSGDEVVTRVVTRRSRGVRAPDNTTQFLMGDMDNWNKARDMEDGDTCYAKREFSKEYEKMAVSKQKMPISKLVEEYFAHESELKDLEKKYAEMTAQEQLKARLGAAEYEWEKGEIFMEPEVAEKIRIFQSEIAKIREENRVLEEENSRLGSENRDSESSSSSSEDDTSSSDSSSSDDDSDTDSSSSSEDEEEVINIPVIEEEQSVTSTEGDAAAVAGTEVDNIADTGYESGGSSNDAARVSSTTLRK